MGKNEQIIESTFHKLVRERVELNKKLARPSSVDHPSHFLLQGAWVKMQMGLRSIHFIYQDQRI